MFEELRIEVNKLCNFACGHCYTVKEGPPGLSVERFAATIDEAAARGATALSLTGGEPLLDQPRTLALIRAGASAGLRVRLNSNGFLIDGKVATALKEAGLSELQTSLNSADADDFNSFVGRNKAFRRVERAVRESARVGIFVSVRFTLMLSNYRQLVPTFHRAKQWGAHKFKVRALVQVSGIHEAGWTRERGTLRAALDDLVTAAHGNAVEVSIADDGLGVRLPTESNCNKQACKCGADALFVASDGEISPCPFLREETAYRLGNLASDDLFELYDLSPKLQAFIGNRTSKVGGNECVDTCKASRLAIGEYTLAVTPRS